MRVIAIVLCAILISSAAAKISVETICPENFKVMADELKKAIDNPKTILEDKRAAVKKLFSLLANCAKEFIKNKITPPTVSLAATQADCDMWKKRVELLKKLIQDPYTRTDRVLGEYAETLYRIQREC